MAWLADAAARRRNRSACPVLCTARIAVSGNRHGRYFAMRRDRLELAGVSDDPQKLHDSVRAYIINRSEMMDELSGKAPSLHEAQT